MTLEESSNYVKAKIESVWDRTDSWTDGELARWCWFCIGNGLSLRVRKTTKLMSIEIDEERWSNLNKESFVRLSGTEIVNRINQTPQSFSRVESILPLKKYRENTSSAYYCLTF